MPGIMTKPKRTNSVRAKSPGQPKVNTRAKASGKSQEQSGPPSTDRKNKPAKCAKDSRDESAPTGESGKRQCRKQTDKCKSQDKPATSKSDENPASKRANDNRRRKKQKDPSNRDRDEPPQTSESKSVKQCATKARKSGPNNKIVGETQAPKNNAQESAKQIDPRKCQSQNEPQKKAEGKQDENPAPKRATANQRNKKQKANSIRDTDESPHMSESKSTEERVLESNTTGNIGKEQGPKTDKESAKNRRQKKKQTDARKCQSQNRPATIKPDKEPAPKRTNNNRKKKVHFIEDESTKKQTPKPTQTQSSESIATDSPGEHHARPHVTEDKLEKVILDTIKQLKIRTNERSAASSYVNEITETVISHLKRNMDWCADIERLTTGSYYENVKICEPDEFDVMLTIPVKRVTIQKFCDKEAFYSVALKRHPTKRFLAKFLNEDKTIRASEMLNEFRNGVKEAVKSLPYKIVVQCKKPRCPAVTLQVTEKGKEISLDFVLGLKVHGSWPQNTQNGFKIEHWLSAKEKTDLKRQPYYLVPKYEGRGNAEHDGVVSKNSWRISFSHVEKDILKRHGNSKTCCESKGKKCCRKECLKLLKYLLSQLKETHSEKMSKFCSYHAKTTLLHACVKRVEDSKWAYSQLADCFQQLLEDFVKFLETQDLPNFFVPSHNLLNPDCVPRSSCVFLAKQIELQRNNNFPIFQ